MVGDIRIRRRSVTIAILAAAIHCGAAWSQEQSYWLRQGFNKVVTCPGAREPKPFRLANRVGQWTTIYGVLTCADNGGKYAYELDYVKVEINKSRLAEIERDPIRFGWSCLAIYGPAEGGRKIQWLYNACLPIEGQIAKSSDKFIAFGNLKFDVPKDRISSATRFTLYLYAEGIPFTFGAL